MPWLVTGSCNHCGVCCLSESLGGFMLENPCIELGEDRCKFFTDDYDPEIGKYGHCLIMQAKRVYPKVRDRFGNRMTDAQIAWFEHNCPMWPARAKDIQALIDRKFELPPECNFEIVWVP